MTDDGRKRSAAKDGTTPVRADRALVGPRNTHEPHEHYTPFKVSLDLDEATDVEGAAIRSRASACSTCQSALAEFDGWLKALGHADPRVGPEFVTRHNFSSELLSACESHHARIALLERDELFHHWGLCTLLAEESAKHRNPVPELALEFGELAETVAAKLDPAFYGESRVADLRARTAACLGNCYFDLGRVDLAEERRRAAHRWLRLGTKSPSKRSDVGTLDERFDKARDKRKRRPADPEAPPEKGR